MTTISPTPVMVETQQKSKLRIVAGASSGIVLPIISELATVTAVPPTDVVLSVMVSIQTACDQADAHKNGFSSIKQYVQKLQELLQQHRQDMESTSLGRPRESYHFQELEKIMVDLQRWSSYPKFKAIFYSSVISNTLKTHRQSIQTMIDQYNYEVGKLNANLSGEAAKAAETLYQTLTAMQEQSKQDDDKLVDDNKSPISRVQFEVRFMAFQNQLREITKVTGRLAPPQLNDAELAVPDRRIVSAGVGSDVLQGLYLGKTKVALKRLRGLHMEDKYIKQFNNELKVWSSVRKHEHLLLFMGWYKLDQEFALVSEWMDNGDITQFCNRNRDADRLHLLAGVADGLNFLHNFSSNEACVHGNLKGSNILVNDKHEAMLYDFQLSKIVSSMNQEREHYDSFTRSASIRWASPEVMADRTMMPPGDVWSFGMVMVEVFTLQEPFPEYPSELTLNGLIRFNNLRPTRPQTDWVTDGVWALMQSCWKALEERPRMDEVHKLVLEAENDRKDHPPAKRFDHRKYNRFAHLDSLYDFSYP